MITLRVRSATASATGSGVPGFARKFGMRAASTYGSITFAGRSTLLRYRKLYPAYTFAWFVTCTPARTDTSGSAVEAFAGGLQNPYDIVFNRQGQLFTADSDMELVVLGQREFAGLIDEVPGFARKLLTGMAARLRDADAKAVQ